MNNEQKVTEDILKSDGDINIRQAVQVAKILVNAPEERLPMILDVFSQAGLDIAGMEEIGALKEIARKRMQIDDLEGMLCKLTKLAKPVSHEYRIPVEMFDSCCRDEGNDSRKVRRILAEMELIRISTLSSGKQNFSVSVYNPETKQITRCICVAEDWRKRLGVDDEK